MHDVSVCVSPHGQPLWHFANDSSSPLAQRSALVPFLHDVSVSVTPRGQSLSQLADDSPGGTPVQRSA